MAFKDITTIIEPLRLPVAGKTYTVPPVGYHDGLRMQAALADGSDDQVSDEEFLEIFLGTALDELRKDNVAPQYILRAALTAHAEWSTGSRDVAEVMWETGGDPKDLEAWKQAQLRSRPQDRKRPASKRSTRTGAASTTPSPASSSGTSTSPSS